MAARFYQEYLPNAVAPDILATNDRSYEEKLASCRMIASVDDPTPTILGVLVLGVSSRDWIPGAYIQFLKGGVGKTSLVYHLAWMFSELGHTVVAVDLDAQANLTAAYLDEDELERLWENEKTPTTIYRAIEPLTRVGDILEPYVEKVTQGLYLIPGDVALASFEDTLSESWPTSMGDANLYRPFRMLSAFWQVAQMAAKQVSANIILVDVGPNLGAINRSALIATD